MKKIAATKEKHQLKTVGTLLEEAKSFIKSFDAELNAKMKQILDSNERIIKEKTALYNQLKLELKNLGFFEFSEKKIKKSKLKELKKEIAYLQSSEYSEALIKIETNDIAEIKESYIKEIDLFLSQKCGVAIEEQYNSIISQKTDLRQDYYNKRKTKSKYERLPSYTQLKNKEVQLLILKYLYTSGKKTVQEMAKIFEVIIPDCTPQYIMALIRPLKENGFIRRSEEKGIAFFQLYDEEDISWYREHPFNKWEFLKEDIILDDEMIPKTPDIHSIFS